MSRSGFGPMSRPGRGDHDDPPPRLKEYRAGRASIELASGDFRLSSADGKTQLLAVAPTSADRRTISGEGSFVDWSGREWKNFLVEAQKFGRSDLIRDLEELKDSIIKGQIPKETPVFDDDAGEKPKVVHTLLVHYSREKGYVKVRGTVTHSHRKKFRSLDLRWDPSAGEWKAKLSGELLEAVVRYVNENSVAYDPEEIGYDRCSERGRWKPREKHYSC